MASRPRRTNISPVVSSAPKATRRSSAAVRNDEEEKKKAEDARISEHNDNVTLAAHMELIQRTKETDARSLAAHPPPGLPGLSFAQMDHCLTIGARRATTKTPVVKPKAPKKPRGGKAARGKAADENVASDEVAAVREKAPATRRGRGRGRGRGGRGGRQANSPREPSPLVSILSRRILNT